MVSADQLFHFTKFEFLINILEKGFYPRYNLEYIEVSDFRQKNTLLHAVPVVCFCDIPLSLVQNHAEKYGKTAIGLSKDWGYKNYINPVFYLQYNSVVADAISNQKDQVLLLANFINKKQIEDKEILDILRQIFASHMVLTSFLKPYEYKQYESVKLRKTEEQLQLGRFYDEREWRYFPMYEVKSRDELFMPIKIYENITKRNKANKNMQQYSLKFDLTDIEYLVVENEQQKIDLRSFLERKFKKDAFDKIKIKVFESL